MTESDVAPQKTPDVITRYFNAQASRDRDTLLTLFTDDADVVNEGQTRRAAKEIRAWRENVASAHEYTTEVLEISQLVKRNTWPAFIWKATSRAVL